MSKGKKKPAKKIKKELTRAIIDFIVGLILLIIEKLI